MATQVRWLCHKTLEEISTAKISEWQSNKTIVTQDFGGNKYSKIAWSSKL